MNATVLAVVAIAGVAGAASAADKTFGFTAPSSVRLNQFGSFSIRLHCPVECRATLTGSGRVRRNGRLVDAQGTKVTGARYTLGDAETAREPLYASNRELALLRRYGSIHYSLTATFRRLDARGKVTGSAIRVHRTVIVKPRR